MNFQPADKASILFFVLFSISMFSFYYKLISKINNWKKWFVAFIAIILIFSIVAISGVVAKSFLPFGPILFLLILVFGLSFSFSKTGFELANAIPLHFLLGFQFFRLPLELILHHWVAIGTIPETMTWTGQNWDIATGIFSIVCIPLVKKNRVIAYVVNTLGFLLLLNVLRVVVLSSPLPFSWKLENPLLLIAYFPYCLIGPLFVMPALIGHMVTFRKLKTES